MGEPAVELQRVVHVIPPNPARVQSMELSPARRQRVAAYCRVSTDDEEQLTSYEMQKQYYTELISSTEGWEFAGIYADRGLSGTSMKNRDEFNRMIVACKRGRIDLILTKSISRFARNTVDCLKTVRMLKGHGIGVRFEKENIDTRKASSEFLITLFSGHAQSESESISKNVTWGKRKAMAAGRITTLRNLFGYAQEEGEEPRIIPEEAAVVRRVYEMYLSGSSLPQIQERLEREGVVTRRGNAWSREAIKGMLRNEKYAGDFLRQKTYCEDLLTHRMRTNRGELPKYYIENSHPAIVERALWNRVQEEMARRAGKLRLNPKNGQTVNGKFSGKYALSERMVCGECGAPYRRCTWVRNGKKRIVWRCVSRLEHGKQFCKDSPTVDEHVVHEAVLRKLNELFENKDELKRRLVQSIAGAISSVRTVTETDAEIGGETAKLNRRLEELRTRQDALIARAAASGALDAGLLKQCEQVNAEMTQTKERLGQIETERLHLVSADERMKAICDTIAALPARLEEYDDSLTAKLVKAVKVYPNRLEVEIV